MGSVLWHFLQRGHSRRVTGAGKGAPALPVGEPESAATALRERGGGGEYTEVSGAASRDAPMVCRKRVSRPPMMRTAHGADLARVTARLLELPPCSFTSSRADRAEAPQCGQLWECHFAHFTGIIVAPSTPGRGAQREVVVGRASGRATASSATR